MGRLVLTNARVVTTGETFLGTVMVENQNITEVQPGATRARGAIDLEADYLLPGLIEIHTDNVERHFVPRSGYLWPSSLSALLAHDTQIAGAGITTVYDAICLGDYDENSPRRELLPRTVEALHSALEHDALRVDHRLHLRCEVSDDSVVDLFERYAGDPLVGLVSVMDHTPGQRQWQDLERMRRFNTNRRNVSDAEFEAMVRQRIGRCSERAEENRRAILQRWRPRGLPSASHDDTTEAHVEQSVEEGISISEFPTTVEAARRARALGMSVVMGSPNVVRGESHSGNVAAMDLVREGLLDGLSSDYFPLSLLEAVFIVHERAGISLPDAVATVSDNVAAMLGLRDRGSIAPGKVADLVQVKRTADSPVVRRVWRAGNRVI